jgi:hypothetical protein
MESRLDDHIKGRCGGGLERRVEEAEQRFKERLISLGRARARAAREAVQWPQAQSPPHEPVSRAGQLGQPAREAGHLHQQGRVLHQPVDGRCGWRSQVSPR